MISSILEIVAKGLAWCFAGWKKKNDPSVAQRTDQVAKDYNAKRKDLQKR